MAEGRRKVGAPELPPVYTVVTAAEALGLDPDELYQLCREGAVEHADLGAGEDASGVYQDHLIRFTPAMLGRARAQLGLRP